MHSRTVAAALAVLALALTGACSSSGSPAEKPSSSSAAPSPSPVDTAAARQACADAWSAVLAQNPDADETADEPAACVDLTDDDRFLVYGQAVRAKIQGNRDRMDACLADPACTELPIG